MWLLPWSRTLPLGTIGINILGSFAISFFGTLTLAHGKYPVAEGWRILFMVGICGGFTTFSSFSLQTFDLLRSGAVERACLNVAVSVAFCLLSVAAGHYAAVGLNGGAVPIAQNVVEEETA